ncbi:1,4-dihydroxy-2-naphthoate octaprenyltransferase [Fictibacillus barbaricus]|uniref:1,4-dihydroxy-2-naphthoate octaprenyltransferase n=1 Tax=Fictibacillus barbaricus TaxID=182136 RepID=A0ABS2ZLL6_9BACL|nr:1,4-dihydroxy-2-naphthoate octaprenyltransferase [Fictibacillus barbaricus]MBN3547526.1 1,4-dihydroxy-2-naphthoate octaprenyltransferase [Fictibacillus barbaricus]GGB49628.1 1,4-dihydroxy-2-naphthoate octaprenyltransferase [Fictibacillus barbaricus]
MIHPKVIYASVRPISLTASIIPVLFGTILALQWTNIHWTAFILTLLGALFLQCGTNLVNDYFDHVKGADIPGSLSPSGVIDRKEMTPRQVYVTGLIFFSLSIIVGLILTALTGPVVLFIGIPSLLVGYFYTATRYALAYNGLGEVASGSTLGILAVVGSFYTQTLSINNEIFLAAIPNALLVMAILHANNLRDFETDKQIGKTTVAGLIGRKASRVEFYILMIGTYVSLTALVLLNILPSWSLIAAITLPLAIKGLKIAVSTWEAKQLNQVLGLTALLHLSFGVLLCIGTLTGILL